MTHYHPLLDQGIDPDDFDDYDVDPDFYLTDESRCSNCGHWFDESELNTLGFVVEESGVSPSTPDGPATYWATGYIVCPNCQEHLPYEVSS